MSPLKARRVLVLTSALFYAASVGAAGTVNFIPSGISGNSIGTGVGDVWVFNCPKDHVIAEISVATHGREMNHVTANTSGLDPAFSLRDKTGFVLANQDNDFNCPHVPINAGTCPRVQNMACGEGPKHYLLIWNNANAPGGAYLLQVLIVDPTGNPLPDKNIALGGRSFSAPSFLSPDKRIAVPLIDDAPLGD